MTVRRIRAHGGVGAGEAGVARVRTLRFVRWLCLASGVTLLAFVGVARLHSTLASQADLERFREARSAREPGALGAALGSSGPLDRSLWSKDRIAAYDESLELDLGLPVAVLRIPRLALEVPVWDGVDELTLNRGLGHIPGTVQPGRAGNVGIAGHRDGFFRVLQRIAPGDGIELETLDATQRFAVEKTLVVAPGEVWVLDPTPGPSLTLVTCYPFYFAGRAPRRFIVRAVPWPMEEPAVESSR